MTDIDTALHTPGDWLAIVDDRTDYRVVVEDGRETLIATVDEQWTGKDGEGKANARLIASAPDLLAERERLREINADLRKALEDAERRLAAISKLVNMGPPTPEDAFEVYQMAYPGHARDALARADLAQEHTD